MTKQIQ